MYCAIWVFCLQLSLEIINFPTHCASQIINRSQDMCLGLLVLAKPSSFVQGDQLNGMCEQLSNSADPLITLLQKQLSGSQVSLEHLTLLFTDFQQHF